MILVATRSTSLREGLLALLTAITPSQTIEFVDDLAEVLKKLIESPVDLVVLDADLPAVSTGIVLGQIKQVSPTAHLLVLTDTVQQQQTALELEAEAVLLKGTPAAEIAATIEQMLDIGQGQSTNQSREMTS